MTTKNKKMIEKEIKKIFGDLNFNGFELKRFDHEAFPAFYALDIETRKKSEDHERRDFFVDPELTKKEHAQGFGLDQYIHTRYMRDFYYIINPYGLEFDGNSIKGKKRKEEIDNRITGFRNAFEGLEGQIVIDLGCGITGDGYKIADFFKAKAYVGVDLHMWEEFVDKTILEDLKGKFVSSKYSNFGQFENHELNNTPMVYVEQGMLDFLRRVPDNSVSLICDGIDGYIISDYDYLNETGKEINRVLSSEGLYFGGCFGGHVTPCVGLREERVKGERVQGIFYRK